MKAPDYTPEPTRGPIGGSGASDARNTGQTASVFVPTTINGNVGSELNDLARELRQTQNDLGARIQSNAESHLRNLNRTEEYFSGQIRNLWTWLLISLALGATGTTFALIEALNR